MVNAASSATGVSASLAIKSMLEENRDRFAAILPVHLKAIPGYEERLIKAALIAVNNQPLLLKCTPVSVVQAVMRAAELGLDPSGTLGSGYLIPYGDQCVFSPGYRGLIDLATRGDSRVLDIEAHVVHENDEFEYCLEYSHNVEPFIRHKPPTLGADRGKIIGAYMVAHLKDGMKKFEVMSIKDLEMVRSKSKMGSSGAWKDFTGQMYRKVVIRRGMNYLPLSPEILSQILSATREDDEIFGINVSQEADSDSVDIPPDVKRMGFNRSRKPKDDEDIIDVTVSQ